VICPYNETELIEAISTLHETISEDDVKHICETIKKIIKKFHIHIDSKQADYNISVARFHGISVIDFLNSPNMDKLKDMYTGFVIDEIIKGVKKLNPSISSKGVWSMIMC